MFHADRWADTFTGALGENAGAGFACLNALVPPVKSARGVMFGHTAAAKLEKILRETVGTADSAAEYAIRFITLLVEKNSFRHIDLVMEKIEKRLDQREGILDVTAESAAPMDSEFQEKLRRMIQERTGAAGLKMKTRLVPELLGGYRLRIGWFYVDASLKRQLEEMTADLSAAALTAGSDAGA